MASNPYDDLISSATRDGPEAVGGNPYDDLVLASAERDRAALSAATLETRDRAPEDYVAAQDLARDRNVPVGVALAARPELEAERERDRMDRLMRESPLTARWASVPENMGVAKDDLGNVGTMEQAFRSIFAPDIRILDAVVRAPAEGAVGDFAGRTLTGLGDLYDVAARAIDRGLTKVGVPQGVQNLGMDPESRFWLNPANWVREPGRGLIAAGDVIGVPEERQNLATDIGQGVGQVGGQAALALATGGSSLTLQSTVQGGSLFAQGASQQAERVEAAGALGSAEGDAAILTGAGVTAVTEKIGLDRLFRALPKPVQERLQRRIADIAVAGVTEGGTEVIEGIGQDLAEYAFYNPDVEFFDGAGNDFTVGASVGFIVRAAVGAKQRGQQAQDSVEDTAKLAVLTEAAARLKTSERSPEAVEAFIRQFREAGQPAPEAVYLDARAVTTYFQQQGMDPLEQMAALTGDEAGAREAIAAGGDLVVPIERWVARVAKSQDRAGLEELGRFDPDRLSAKELAEFDPDAVLAEVLGEARDDSGAAARALDSAVDQDPVREVYNDVVGQLVGAGVERSAAESQATVLAQRYATRAERRGLGESALDVYRLSGLVIDRETPGQAALRQAPGTLDTSLDPLIDAVRTGRIPTDRDVYGDSLVTALIRAGGIRPDSMGAADLRSQGAGQRPGLFNASGMTVDEALVWAFENGYLDTPPTNMQEADAAFDNDAPDMNSILNMITDELNGTPSFARANENPRVAEFRRAAQELAEMLGEAGVDLSVVRDNEAIKRLVLDGIAVVQDAVGDQVGADAVEPGGRVLYQDALPEETEADALRRRLAEVEAERDALAVELRTSALTGLRNKRAFEEDADLGWPSVGIMDMDGLKILNDTLGHGAGDVALRQVGSLILKAQADGDAVLGGEGVRFYHLSGDEYAMRLQDPARADEILADLQARLDSVNLQFTLTAESGEVRSYVYEGIGLTYAQGSSFEQADQRLNQAKLDREASGARDPRGAGTTRRIRQIAGSPARRQSDRPAGEPPAVNRARNLSGLRTFLQADRVAADQTDTPEFKRWFGDSKVVDADGKPLVVYHGTGRSFDSFDPAQRGAVTGAKSAKALFFFTDSAEVASDYADFAATKPVRDLVEKSERLERQNKWDEAAEVMAQAEELDANAAKGQAVIPAFLSISDPAEFDADGESWQEIQPRINRLIADAQRDGRDGVIVRNLVDDPSEIRQPSTHYGVFQPTQIKSATGNRGTFDPNNPSILEQRNAAGRRPVEVQRGRIEFRSDGSARIVLTKDANLSTFLHETGHLWLDELIVDATTQGTDPALAADLDRVLAWMGLDVRAASGREAILEAVGTTQHESWARGFEAYLREGRAPSPQLRDIFARFRAWLVRLYKDVSALDVQLSDEVRAVMGRLIATDEEIAAASASNRYTAIAQNAAAAAELGMTEAEYDEYRAVEARALDEAKEEIEQDLLAAWEREAKSEYRAEFDRLREEVEAEVNERPVYRAMLALMSRDGPKLDKADLIEAYGEAFLARLPGPGGERANRGGYIYSLSGGLSVDEAAFMFGFNSGDALVQALVNAQNRRELIEAEAKDRMGQFYPDPMLDGSLAERAQKAVHSGARMEVLERELAVLARQAGAAPTQARVVSEIARRMIGRRAIRQLRPREFLAAERKAAKEAMKAIAARQFDIAYRAKFRQTLNARAYALALQAQDRVEKDRRYLARFDKKATREKVGKAGNGYLEQIDLILDKLDLRRVSGAEIDRLGALRQMDEAIADGRLVVSPDVRARVEAARRTNWRELTVEDLGAMTDAVRQVDALARRELEVVLEGERRQLEDDAMQVADSVLGSADVKALNLGTRTSRESVAKFGKEALAIWLRPSEIARQADGGKPRGAATRLIIEPIRRAVAEKLEPMKAKAREDLADLYTRFYTKAELVKMSRRRIAMPEIGQNWTRLDLISLALNWGNADNRAAVLDGEIAGAKMFTQEGVKAALSRMTAKDWEFVQAAWDYIDSYWPQISEVQKRRTGLSPAKVEAAPFKVRVESGQEIELRGGYYPLVYDTGNDAQAKLDDLEDAFKRIMNGRNAKAATARGHTIERVGSGGRPVRFGINVMHTHLNSVIHDLALGDAVDYVYKVLNWGNVKSAFAQTGRLEDWKALNIWLKDAAAGEMAARNALDVGFRWLRIGFTKSKLGFNIITALLQPTGILQSAVVVGKRNMVAGLTQMLSQPAAAYRQVMEQSDFMRTRYQVNAWNKDVQDSMDALRGRFGIVPSWVGPAMFLMITQTQKVVDVSSWLAGYRRGLSEYDGDHAQAVALADSIVENAQTSGFFSDRSAIERGSLSDTNRQSEFVRSWTTLISYMLAKGNIAYGRVKSTNYRSIPSVANLAADMAMLFTAEALLAAIIRGTWPDEDEDWWWWLGKETAASAASTIPFVRDAASGVKGFPVTGGPQGAFLNDIGKVSTQIGQGEVDAALLKAANNVGGTLFHYPSAQMNRAIDAYWREEVEGEDVPAYEYLTGQRDRQ